MGFKRRTGEGFVYFITCGQPQFPIKIGFALDMRTRMHNIQSCLPFEIVVLHVLSGTKHTEFQLHGMFNAVRMRGEWFRRDQSILDYIAKLKRDGLTAPERNADEPIIITAPPGMSDKDKRWLGID